MSEIPSNKHAIDCFLYLRTMTYSLELWKATVLIFHESPNERLRMGNWLSRNSCVWSYIATDIYYEHLHTSNNRAASL